MTETQYSASGMYKAVDRRMWMAANWSEQTRASYAEELACMATEFALAGMGELATYALQAFYHVAEIR